MSTTTNFSAIDRPAKRPERTAEELLKILQLKSISQGRPYSWKQIKDDPDLDQEEIKSKLGLYAVYERRLLPKDASITRQLTTTRNVTSQTTTTMPSASRRGRPPKADSALSVTSQAIMSSVVSQSAMPSRSTASTNNLILASLSVSESNSLEASRIVLSKIDKMGVEQKLEFAQLQLIAAPANLNYHDLKRILHGMNPNCWVKTANVFASYLEFLLQRNPPDEKPKRIAFRVAVNQQTQFCISVYTPDEVSMMNGYIILEQKRDLHNTETEIIENYSRLSSR